MIHPSWAVKFINVVIDELVTVHATSLKKTGNCLLVNQQIRDGLLAVHVVRIVLIGHSSHGWNIVVAHGHPTRIHPQRRPIPNIPVQVDIAGGEAEGVFAEEPAGAGVVPAGAVEVEAGGGVPLPARVGEPGLELAVRLADDLAERVVADVVDDRGRPGGRVVLHQVADRAEVVAEAPGDGSSSARGDLLVRQDLVGGRAVEVAVGENVGGSRERQDQIVAVVDEPLRRNSRLALRKSSVGRSTLTGLTNTGWSPR